MKKRKEHRLMEILREQLRPFIDYEIFKVLLLVDDKDKVIAYAEEEFDDILEMWKTTELNWKPRNVTDERWLKEMEEMDKGKKLPDINSKTFINTVKRLRKKYIQTILQHWEKGEYFD